MPSAAAVEKIEAQVQSSCIVCGPDNEHGLHITFQADAAGVVTAEWQPARRWEGFRGVIHGGIVSTVLDEAMSKTIAFRRTQALTCELRVRLRRRVTTGETYRVRAWTVEQKGRRITTEAVLTAPEGDEHAHAWGMFLALPEPSRDA